jgi:hypothetical protein
MDTEAGHGTVKATLASTLKPKGIAFSNKPPVMSICIDKVSITLDEDKDDKHHGDAILETIYGYAKPGLYPFDKHGRVSAKGGRYKAALRIHAPNPPGDIHGGWSEEFALLQCAPKNNAGGFLRLEWNPAKWTALASGHLLGTVSAVMLHTEKFNQLLANAKVTRIDVALGVLNIRPDDYLWELSKGVYRKVFIKGGKVETVYLGKLKAGKGGIRIYDKGAEMGIPSLKQTRIERVYKDTKLRVRDLPKLDNVFRTLICRDARAALAGLDFPGVPPMYRSFVHDSCAYRGFRSALDQIDSTQLRKRLIKAITSSVPGFWNMEVIWSGWHAAIAHVFAHTPVPPPE